MFDFTQNCKFYRHCMIFVQLFCGFQTYAGPSDISRAPANFVPDDDLIVVPMVIEKNFIEEFNDKHEKEFRSARQKLQYWITQEEYAKNYGLENTGIVTLPTEEEKQKFLERNYLRFLSKDVEKSTNAGLKDTWESWNEDDEIDAINAVELHEKVLVKAEKDSGKKTLKTSKSVKVGKDTFKFGFQPRVEIGMVKFTMKSKYFSARAWVGINGNQELKVERKFKSTNTSAFINYYIDESRLLAAVDQRLTDEWSLRYTHTKDAKDFDGLQSAGEVENNILQLRYRLSF